MFWTRLLIVCSLLIAVPMQGMAVAVQIKQPCPMESMMTQPDMSDAHGVEPVTRKGDCCLDDEAAALSGQSCKPGQECHAGQFSIMNTVPVVSVHAASHAPSYFPDPAYAPLALTAIWRPPLTLLH